MNRNPFRPKVSVCVITYNHEKYLEKCLQSIVDQKVDFDFEIIIGDDCSTDGSCKIIEKFTSKYYFIKAIFRKENSGGSLNFINVHNMAQGEYVCHMDGDDYWLPGKMAFQAKILDDNNDIVQCWTCANYVNSENAVIGVFPSRFARKFNPVIIDSSKIALSYALVGQHSTQMYRRSARKVELIGAAPLDYWVAFIISLNGLSYYSKSILSAYRVGENKSITRTKSSKKVAVDFLAIHLNEIIIDYPEYLAFAKANLLVRYIISKIRCHDLSVIQPVLLKAKNAKTNYLLVLKSFWYFLIQKIQI
jgi:glycosyltransferase involved in cell wall biosynthesis